MEWKKIVVTYTSDKGLITKIYRGLKKLISKKIKGPVKKWANELNRAFSKEVLQMAKKTQEEMLTIPGHEGNARFHPTPVRMATIKYRNNNKYWQGCGEKRTLHTLMV
jgi:hypothetical protein